MHLRYALLNYIINVSDWPPWQTKIIIFMSTTSDLCNKTNTF